MKPSLLKLVDLPLYLTTLLSAWMLGLILLFGFDFCPMAQGLPFIDLVFYLSSVILLLFIGGFLLLRGLSHENVVNVLWSAAFLLYAFMLLGSLLSVLNLFGVDVANPQTFWFFRQFHVLIVALLFAGVLLLGGYTKRHVLKVVSVLIVLEYVLLGLVLFATGGMSTLDLIDVQMGLFVLVVWLPLTLFISFAFYKNYVRSRRRSALYLSVAFLLMSIAYLFWGPFHACMLFYAAFALFIISLCFVLVGVLSMD